MKRKRRLSDSQELSLLCSFQCGDTFREAAEKSHVSLNTVCHRFAEYEQEHSFLAEKRRECILTRR
jgi:cytidylate kinase